MIIKIPVEPYGTPRPRFSRRGNYVQTYHPAKYTQYKHSVKQFLPRTLFDNVPISVKMLFIVKIPNSWSKSRKRAAVGKWCMKKPDVDNYAKAILDAGNEHTWQDDSIVVDLHVKKKYGIEPCVYLKITKLEE